MFLTWQGCSLCCSVPFPCQALCCPFPLPGPNLWLQSAKDWCRFQHWVGSWGRGSWLGEIHVPLSMSALLLSLLDIFSFPHCDPQPEIIEKQYKASYLSLFEIAACSTLKFSKDSGAEFFKALLYFWTSSTKFSNVYKTWDCFLQTPNRWSQSPPIFHFFMGYHLVPLQF